MKDEIKQDIENRIAKINKSFSSFTWINIYKDGLYEEETEPLEKLLNKTMWRYKAWLISAIVASLLIIGFTLITFPTSWNLPSPNINNLRIPLFITALIDFYAFTYYRFKSALENKIFMVKLLDKVNLLLFVAFLYFY